MRGLRHKEDRPDLIICDDIENIDDVRTKEQRDKTEEWLGSDVVPALDIDKGKLIILGNILHPDGIMARIEQRWTANKIGIVKSYPLITPEGFNIWATRYDEEKIRQIKAGGLAFWKREYLLMANLTEDQIVKRVGYYATLPKLNRIAIGVDLAISEKTTADYTAINVAGQDADKKIYNLKIEYARMNFNATLERIKATFDTYQGLYPGLPVILGVESVAYQKAAVEEIRRRYQLPVYEISQTKDKKARIETMLPYLENDQILFKREGQEDLLAQLFGLGIEAHDDCVDAAEISWRLLINYQRPTFQTI